MTIFDIYELIFINLLNSRSESIENVAKMTGTQFVE